ncbi:MAG: hypothetical protein ACI8PB_004727 [Desulforhopalus sp.]|jgi:hypothetical protein
MCPKNINMHNNIDIQDYCQDIYKWPQRWKMIPEDIGVGEGMLKEIIPFMEFLVSKKYKQKTLNKHFNNLWLLGGELIDRIDKDEELRQISPLHLILQNIDSSGGPYSKHLDSDYEFESFDSTCRKFYNYLKQNINIT